MLHYRKAILTDIPMLVSLRIEFLKEVMHTDTPGNDITAGLEQYFTQHLEQGKYINWLAIDNDRIVGTGGICFYSIPPNFFNPTGDKAYILNVYTLPAYRRKGISKKIFSNLMNEAEARGVLQLSLHATPDGAPLYQQFGFRPKDNEMVWGKQV